MPQALTEKKPEDPLYLKLFDNKDMTVTLKIVRLDGTPVSKGMICTISREGQMEFHAVDQDVALKAGISLNTDGTIHVTQ